MILNSFKHSYCKRVYTSTSDGAGGTTNTISYEDEFNGYQGIANDKTSIKQERLDDRPTYNLLVNKSTELSFGDILKREDGKLYRVLEYTDDHYTPVGSPLNMNSVTIEEYEQEVPQ